MQVGAEPQAPGTTPEEEQVRQPLVCLIMMDASCAVTGRGIQAEAEPQTRRVSTCVGRQERGPVSATQANN